MIFGFSVMQCFCYEIIKMAPTGIPVGAKCSSLASVIYEKLTFAR